MNYKTKKQIYINIIPGSNKFRSKSIKSENLKISYNKRRFYFIFIIFNKILNCLLVKLEIKCVKKICFNQRKNKLIEYLNPDI